ncbi:MAG: hypothetical protein R3A44_00795 [Caldilineaceae bacterium]
MAKIIFTTCNRWPELYESDQLIADALLALGHQVHAVRWQDNFQRFVDADLIILRAHWDYHYELPAFQQWLERLKTAALPVHNPPPLVRWNLAKRNLFELQEKGISIPATAVLEPGADPAVIYAAQGWTQAVIKPLVGASGHLVERVNHDALATWKTQVRTQRPQAHWLIQEFLPEIQTSGELSLVFLGGDFSHAIAKRPNSGEFRITSQYRGQIERIEPSLAIMMQARQILAVLPETPLYARVDGVVKTDGRFCLIELELNEPGLYFMHAPEQPTRFAQVINAQLASV